VDKVELAIASLLYPAARGIFLRTEHKPLAKYDGIHGMNMFLSCFERHENPVDTGHKRYLVTLITYFRKRREFLRRHPEHNNMK
jgi:hypothetical protein